MPGIKKFMSSAICAIRRTHPTPAWFPSVFLAAALDSNALGGAVESNKGWFLDMIFGAMGWVGQTISGLFNSFISAVASFFNISQLGFWLIIVGAILFIAFLNFQHFLEFFESWGALLAMLVAVAMIVAGLLFILGIL